MAYSEPQRLSSTHELDSFDCGKAQLNTWLMRHALQAQASGSARTYVIKEQERIAGYFSLTVGQVDAAEAPARVSKGMGRYPIPVMVLSRLAVSIQDQGRGVGVGMLQEAIRRTVAIAEQAGVRAMLVHPIDDEADRFYRKFGFEASPIREQQLLLLMKDARKLLVGGGQ